MTKKTLLPTNDLYVQFTDEEIQELGWEAGQKLEVKQHDDGSIELRPYVKIELDMEEWPREVLEMIVKESCEKDISANDVINNLLKQSLKDFPVTKREDVVNDSRELLLEKDYLYNADIDPNFTNNDIGLPSGVAVSVEELTTASHIDN
jgi:bifunctional DNA-binding transcriptional regulator/antitoxin component of YhaV-PrlF toxin-antitoxin module